MHPFLPAMSRLPATSRLPAMSRLSAMSRLPRRRSGRPTLPLLALVAVAAACTDTHVADKATDEIAYKATIRWTSHGIPHIEADDLGSAGYAQGWAFAKLGNACELADQIIKVRGERARYLGPGPDDAYVRSDLVYLGLGLREDAASLWSDLSADSRAVIGGYAAGYNAWLAEAGPSGLPAACRDVAWVRPIDGYDLLAYYFDISMLASTRLFVKYLIDAVPPPKTVADATPATDGSRWYDAGARLERFLTELAALPDAQHPGLASNGWAIGKERATNGRGMVLGNPHFPWVGELKLYESHLKVGDDYEVAGAALYGVPGVLMGFSRDIAWTHTVSASKKFTFYRLKLVDGEPTHYLYDGEDRAMTSREVSVEVLQGDGTMKSVSHTFWRSHFGPMLALPPVALWTKTEAFSIRDANAHNLRLLDHFLAFARAGSVAEAGQVLATVQANPWTNTMAADKDGKVLYSESNSVPNLKAAAEQVWLAEVEDDVLVGLAAELGAMLLDGSSSATAWVEEPGSRAPGLVPYDKTPHLERDDWVANHNDSHWLANPAAPLTGYNHTFGAEGVVQSQRTRMGLKMIAETGADSPAGADGTFTVEELQATVFNNRVHTAELLLDGAIARCQQTTTVEISAVAVPLSAACTVLADWDRRMDLDSKGAVLYREWLGWLDGDDVAGHSGGLYAVGFDAADPVATPNTLKPPAPSGKDAVLFALGKAVVGMQAAGVSLDATLAALQFTDKAGVRAPIHGGSNREGAFNVVEWAPRKTTVAADFPHGKTLHGATGLTDKGYPIDYGSSFVMAMRFTESGPEGWALLTYSQSSDPASPWYADQTDRFAKKQWRRMWFDAADILADPELVGETVTGAGLSY